MADSRWRDAALRACSELDAVHLATYHIRTAVDESDVREAIDALHVAMIQAEGAKAFAAGEGLDYSAQRIEHARRFARIAHSACCDEVEGRRG